MDDHDRAFLTLLRQQDQQEAEAVESWLRMSAEAKKLVWAAIQSMGSEPLAKLIAMYATLGMTRVALLAEQQEKEVRDDE